MTREIEQHTRKDQFRYAFNLLESMSALGDTTQLPEAVQLANEDSIKAAGGEIKINEKFRDRYAEVLAVSITEGEYYKVETLTARVVIERVSIIE